MSEELNEAVEDVKNRLEEIEYAIEDGDIEDAMDLCRTMLDEVATLRNALRAERNRR